MSVTSGIGREAMIPNPHLGSDDERGALTMLYFDERAVTRRFDVTVAGGVLRWSRMAPGFSQRFTLTVLPGGDGLHGVSEMSKDGATWEKDLELRYTRGDRPT